DERRPRLAVDARDVRAAVPPELVVRAGDVRVRIVAAIVAVRLPGDARLELFRLRVAHELAACELRRALERRDRREVPDALEIRLSIGGAKGFRRRLRGD